MLKLRKPIWQYCAEKRARNGEKAARKPRKPLRRVSDKRRAELPARKACCDAVRERSGGRCEVRISPDCSGRMDHTHEIKARGAGGSITDPENCLATCFHCHSWIDAHANAARKLGFVAPRGA